MAFYHLPNPWDPKYAIPEYVMAEPPERGTFTTQWLPRGTISQLVPDFLFKPGKRLLGRDDAGLGSLGGNTLKGNILRGNTLAGSSLGADVVLEHEGAHADASLAEKMAADAAAAARRAREMKTGMVVGAVAAGVVALLVFGGKKKRK